VLQISLINHASILLESEGIKLLTDPWYEGTCFDKGWGLLYNNSKAYEAAATATHLWISHFHSDHFHVATLKKILAINPNLICLGNHSYNFKIDEALKNIGFKNVIALKERQPLALSNKISITRYPTTGIDNMLLIKTPEGNILNFNDCNIPERTRKYLAKKMGSIAVMLNNFNHAGKIMEYPFPTPEAIAVEQQQYFKNNFSSFNPKWIIPFASYHYYTSPFSVQQNPTLLGLENIIGLAPNIINAPLGTTISFSQNFESPNIQQTFNLNKNTQTIIATTNNYTDYELQLAAQQYTRKLKKGFGFLANRLKPLVIALKDSNTVVQFSTKKGLEFVTDNRPTHIITNSQQLHNWFTQEFGTDNFVVGAHFDLTNEAIPMRWQTLLGLLTENRLDARSIFGMLFSFKGWQFLWNRKHEIYTILRSKKLISNAQR
jgi:L-ascorbate metabolism protein UlaG (beta-lactamase superfamily)